MGGTFDLLHFLMVLERMRQTSVIIGPAGGKKPHSVMAERPQRVKRYCHR